MGFIFLRVLNGVKEALLWELQMACLLVVHLQPRLGTRWHSWPATSRPGCGSGTAGQRELEAEGAPSDLREASRLCARRQESLSHPSISQPS